MLTKLLLHSYTLPLFPLFLYLVLIVNPFVPPSPLPNPLQQISIWEFFCLANVIQQRLTTQFVVDYDDFVHDLFLICFAYVIEAIVIKDNCVWFWIFEKLVL